LRTSGSEIGNGVHAVTSSVALAVTPFEVRLLAGFGQALIPDVARIDTVDSDASAKISAYNECLVNEAATATVNVEDLDVEIEPLRDAALTSEHALNHVQSCTKGRKCISLIRTRILA